MVCSSGELVDDTLTIDKSLLVGTDYNLPREYVKVPY